MILLEVEEVNVSFGGLAALKDVSFSLSEGEIVGRIGPNGAGKTTLFNCLSGFQPVGHGHLRFRGTPLETRAPHEIAALGIACMSLEITLLAARVLSGSLAGERAGL